MKDPALIDRLKELEVLEPIQRVADHFAGCYRSEGVNICACRGMWDPIFQYGRGGGSTYAFPTVPHDRRCEISRVVDLFASPEGRAALISNAHEFAIGVEYVMKNPGPNAYDLVRWCREFAFGRTAELKRFSEDLIKATPRDPHACICVGFQNADCAAHGA